MKIADWPLVGDQIDNARSLAEMDEGRPRPASLRRAVSTAYYALFQALCALCVDELVGWDGSWDAVTPIYRSLEHGAVGRALYADSSTNDPELKRLGAAFKELQTAREWADYNPEPRPNYHGRTNSEPFKRDEALLLIDTASKAIQILDRLDDDRRLTLAARLASRNRK